VRLFVRHEDDMLEKRAGRKNGTKEARFFALLRIARRHDLDRWQMWLSRHFEDDGALALTCTSLELGRFDAHLPAAIQVLAGVLQDLRMIGEIGEDEDLSGIGSLADLISEFERLMGEMRPKADGAFLDADVLRAHYRTCFYSALTILGEHLRRSLSSLPDTRAFASDLGTGDEGVAGEFQRWYVHLANAKAGQPDLTALRKDLVSMPHFGAPLLLRTFEAIQDHSPPGDVGPRTAARRIVQSLDTRPEDLLAFATIMHQEVLDLERAENLYARGLARAAPRRPACARGGRATTTTSAPSSACCSSRSARPPSRPASSTTSRRSRRGLGRGRVGLGALSQVEPQELGGARRVHRFARARGRYRPGARGARALAAPLGRARGSVR
jgi:hypothetical protein